MRQHRTRARQARCAEDATGKIHQRARDAEHTRVAADHRLPIRALIPQRAARDDCTAVEREEEAIQWQAVLRERAQSFRRPNRRKLMASRVTIEHFEHLGNALRCGRFDAERAVVATPRRSHEQRVQFREERIPRQTARAAFQQPPRTVVVGCDACEIQVRRVVPLQRAEEAVAVPQDAEAPARRRVEAKFAEVAHAPRRTIHPALAARAAAHAHEPIIFKGDDRLIFATRDIRPAKIIGLALECDADRAAHWILAEQSADRGVVRGSRGGECDTGFQPVAHRRDAGVTQFAVSSGPCHDSSPSG